MWSVLISGITELIKSYFSVKSQAIKTKADRELRIEENVSDYDLQAMKNMQHTWKDEYLIAIHTFPIWGYLIPSDDLTTRLNMLWYKLGTAPDMWWAIYIGIVISTFGLRWMSSRLMNAKRI